MRHRADLVAQAGQQVQLMQKVMTEMNLVMPLLTAPVSTFPAKTPAVILPTLRTVLPSLPKAFPRLFAFRSVLPSARFACAKAGPPVNFVAILNCVSNDLVAAMTGYQIIQFSGPSPYPHSIGRIKLRT